MWKKTTTAQRCDPAAHPAGRSEQPCGLRPNTTRADRSPARSTRLYKRFCSDTEGPHGALHPNPVRTVRYYLLLEGFQGDDSGTLRSSDRYGRRCLSVSAGRTGVVMSTFTKNAHDSGPPPSRSPLRKTPFFRYFPVEIEKRKSRICTQAKRN